MSICTALSLLKFLLGPFSATQLYESKCTVYLKHFNLNAWFPTPFQDSPTPAEEATYREFVTGYLNQTWGSVPPGLINNFVASNLVPDKASRLQQIINIIKYVVYY